MRQHLWHTFVMKLAYFVRNIIVYYKRYTTLLLVMHFSWVVRANALKERKRLREEQEEGRTWIFSS